MCFAGRFCRYLKINAILKKPSNHPSCRAEVEVPHAHRRVAGRACRRGG